MKKILAVCLAVFLVLPIAASCSVAKTSEVILVPSFANTVVKVQVNNVLNNTVLQIAYEGIAKNNPALPQSVNDTLNQLSQKTGFDLSSISTAVLFANVQATSQAQNAYIGMIASGTFDESAFIANIEQQTKHKITTTVFKGITVYAGDQNKFEMAFLNQSQLAFGTPTAVRDIIDVSKKDQPALNGSIIDILNRLGPALIVGASIAPENLRNELVKGISQQTTLPLNSFKDVDTIGFSIDQPSLSLSVRIDAHFFNINSLQNAKDTITGLISVAKGTSQDTNFKTALDNIQVGTTDSWLSVRGLINPADIAALIGSIQQHK